MSAASFIVSSMSVLLFARGAVCAEGDVDPCAQALGDRRDAGAQIQVRRGIVAD